uniref:C-type lectin domain-containing protein n=1 Tax=Buteo japonicus TaxID=224669 RepID=A0A8B9YXC9_9AVES
GLSQTSLRILSSPANSAVQGGTAWEQKWGDDFPFPGQNCVLCPANWKWEGGDTCYYYPEGKKSWEESHQFCSSRNSTLLLIKDQAKLNLVGTFPRGTYWFGLIFRRQQRTWYWTDNTPLTEEQKPWTKQIRVTQPCGYFYHGTIYSGTCSEENYFICEKPAIQLQRGNNHWQEDWFVRPE